MHDLRLYNEQKCNKQAFRKLTCRYAEGDPGFPGTQNSVSFPA